MIWADVNRFKKETMEDTCIVRRIGEHSWLHPSGLAGSRLVGDWFSALALCSQHRDCSRAPHLIDNNDIIFLFLGSLLHCDVERDRKHPEQGAEDSEQTENGARQPTPNHTNVQFRGILQTPAEGVLSISLSGGCAATCGCSAMHCRLLRGLCFGQLMVAQGREFIP